MKKFADLNLRLPLENIVQSKNMLQNASKLGYSLVAIPFPPKTKKEKIMQIKKLCNEEKIDFVSRTNIYPRNSNELIYYLRNFRRKFEIVSIRCNTKDVARQAAKDRRVDLLQFSVTNPRKRFFDKQEAELSSQALSALEIELAPLLQLTSYNKTRMLYTLRGEIAIAQRVGVPIILSSGASSELFMRGPYDFSALALLFDMSYPASLKALSDNSVNLVKKNRQKLSSDFIAPGIKIIGSKKSD
ncbi:hypothetical protein KJN74_03845 [Candidatus Bathyarchaeota archaeon]|nr:hypothetical protein [Candidatus Bathyarchaeota archaeon]